MKTVRLVLLLLLAVLLPLRGVVAASMACALPQAPASLVMPTVDPHEPPGHHADHAPAAPASHDSADKCPLCVAGGVATALPMQAPQLPPSPPGPRVRFPALAEEVTAFVPDGPERPPRRG